MSTENEGAAVTPAAGPPPTPGATTSSSPADAAPSPGTSGATSPEDDFALAEPGAEAAAASDPSPGPERAADREDEDAYAAFASAFDTPEDGAAPAADPSAAGKSAAGKGEDTAVLKPVDPSAAPPPAATAEKPTTALRQVDEPADAAPADAPPVAPVAPAAPATAAQQQPAPQQPQAAQQAQQPPHAQSPHIQAAHAQPPHAGPAPAADQPAPQWGGGTPPPPPPHGGGHGGGPGGPGPGPGSGDPGGNPGGGYGGGPHNPWNAPPPPPSPPGGRKRPVGALIAAVLVAALVAGGIGGGIGFWAAERNDGSGSTTVNSDGSTEALNRSPESVAGIAAKALPSVVTIETRGGGGAGTGTGFVFDKEGHILTNNHVVASAADGGKLTATFSDGKSYDAEIVGRAQGYDVAVIKLENTDGRELEPLPLGNSDKTRVGDATIAIGAPYGLSGTVTTGIVSAKSRPVASSDAQGADASYMSALQTDASINPGNSGGPLLNAKGAVIGVNSAIRSSGGGLGQGQSGSIGLGFAIPVNQAERVAKELIETGVPVYPVIGVHVNMGEQGKGAVVAEDVNDGEPVTPGGPADKAGLEPGDVITEFDGTAVDSGPTLIASIWAHEPGETVELTYQRGGQEQTVEITLGSRKGDE